ncbi:MAG: hypothetical protein Q8M03_03580 [Legionella sp.]|nr:hypothetical protein [Legionella sp.]
MKKITLTVIFEGTIFSIEAPNSHLYQVLNHDCKGTRVGKVEDLQEGETHFKMGFNGCAIDYGLSGTLFGTGVDQQSDQALAVVKALIKTGHKVRLNVIGLSRGGVASLLLAKKLAAVDPYHLETNLLLLDPVSGNLLTTAKLDILGVTLTNQVLNISESRNLNYVKSLYPYMEVGDDTETVEDKLLANFHVPIRPTYPDQALVEEDVILGIHLSAFRAFAPAAELFDLVEIIKKLSKNIINKFLIRVGAFEGDPSPENELDASYKVQMASWISKLNDIIETVITKDRPLHSEDGSRIQANNEGEFLNREHLALANRKDNDLHSLSLNIVPERPRVEIDKLSLTPEVLSDLIAIMEASMTAISKTGKKGQLLAKKKEELFALDKPKEKQLSYILRDLLGIALQRTRFAYSFYKTTSTGTIILAALNTPAFAAIRQCIRPDDKALCYDDLCGYVLGRNELLHFNSQYMDVNLNNLLSPASEDHFLDYLM